MKLFKIFRSCIFLIHEELGRQEIHKFKLVGKYSDALTMRLTKTKCNTALKDSNIDSLFASICFEVQSGSREDFAGLGRDRSTSSVALVRVG